MSDGSAHAIHGVIFFYALGYIFKWCYWCIYGVQMVLLVYLCTHIRNKNKVNHEAKNKSTINVVAGRPGEVLTYSLSKCGGLHKHCVYYLSDIYRMSCFLP